MNQRAKEGFIRLVLGFLLNLPLFFLAPRIALWGGIERQVVLNLLYGSLAVATVVVLTPIFWRGAPWQAPLAFVLIAFLPGLALISVISVIVQSW